MNALLLWKKLINLITNSTVWKGYLNYFEKKYFSQENKLCIAKSQNIYDSFMSTDECQFDENYISYSKVNCQSYHLNMIFNFCKQTLKYAISDLASIE